MEQIVYVLLFVTSVVGLSFIVERGLALRWRQVVPPEVEAAVEACQAGEDVPSLRRVCAQHKSPLSRLLLVVAEHLDWPKAEVVDALQTRARQEVARLERGLVVLEIIVGIAPLLGLICQKAVLDPAPFGAWPSDMRRTLGNTRNIQFTFHYN